MAWFYLKANKKAKSEMLLAFNIELVLTGF